ncbi:adenylyl cyclase-associated protein [Physcia stellaris]|nr:adenylyl cyclase-associated protein [Physcia stellaris]
MAEAEIVPAEQIAVAEKLAAETTTTPIAEKTTTPEENSIEEKDDPPATTQNKLEEKSSEPKAPSTNGDAESETPSKRVQEARSYNSRYKDRGRGGRGGSQSYRRNIKSDLTSQEESSDPVEIRKQVQLTLAFLFERVGGHSNLPVPISIIHSFKRMQHFQPLSAVVAALRDSTTLDLVDNDSCIKRKYPLSDEVKDKPLVEIQKVYEDKAMAKSVYAKGFGAEEPGTQFDVEAFFSEFGTTNSVRLRRTDEKIFKGSVFVEFDTEETQKNFLALDPKPKWRGKELLIKSKKQYCDEKVDEIAAGRIKAKDQGSSKDNYGNRRGGSDNRDWKTRRDEDQANGFRDDRDRKDRRGNRRGFGSSGQRGRGDRRGGGRGRDRNNERRNDHDRKAPTIESTSPPKASKLETPTKPTTSAISEPTDTAMTDATSPTQASKKRPREDDGADALERNYPKAQKIADAMTAVAASVSAPSAPAPSESPLSVPAPSAEKSKKRARQDDDGGADEGTRAKAAKVADDEAS